MIVGTMARGLPVPAFALTSESNLGKGGNPVLRREGW